MRLEIREMPSKVLLEEYLAGAFGNTSAIFDQGERVFKKVAERPLFRPTSNQTHAYTVRIDGWGPIPEIRQMPNRTLLENYLNHERACFRPILGVFEFYNRFAKTPLSQSGDEGEERLQSSAADT